MDYPLVSVICLCYDQERFVREAIDSVLNQSYPNIELIVVDDASSDTSAETIQNIIKKNSSIRFLPLVKNVGNCQAFNKGFALSKGAYIIDLAADDILLPQRIEQGVAALRRAGKSYGVNFSDAQLISERGDLLNRHSQRFPHHTVPQGDIYKNVIERFFICSPTVMFTREVIEYLDGYDETLSYEDFDFWIRSSRRFYYCYTPEVLAKKRIVRKSLSEKQFNVLSPQLHSTYKVLEKIMFLNKSKEEQKALSGRIIYEFTVSLRLLSLRVAWKYLRLWFKNQKLQYE